VLDGGEQPVAVARRAAAEEGLRVARGLMDDLILGRVGAELVVADLGEAGAIGDRDAVAGRRDPAVVEAAAVGRPRRAGVFGAGDDVGRSLPVATSITLVAVSSALCSVLWNAT